MAKQLGVAEGLTYTCETAAYFWLLHVLSRWEKFSADAAAKQTPECIKELFPFKARAPRRAACSPPTASCSRHPDNSATVSHLRRLCGSQFRCRCPLHCGGGWQVWRCWLLPTSLRPGQDRAIACHLVQDYFADAPEEVFKGASYAEDLERARGCFRHLRRMFQELEECRAFELLKARRRPHAGCPARALEPCRRRCITRGTVLARSGGARRTCTASGSTRRPRKRGGRVT